MIKRFSYLLLLIIPFLSSCNRGKPDVTFSVKYEPYSVIAATSKRIYYINPDSAVIYKRVYLPHSIERVFEPFPYDQLILYKSRKIDIFDIKSGYIENSINARNTAYNLFALNPYRKLVYQSDTDIFLIENNTLFKIAHSDKTIDTSFTFNSGKYIVYRTKEFLNYMIKLDSMKISRFGYYKNIVSSPYLYKLYFIDHGFLSFYDAKKNKKRNLDIKCSGIKLAPAANRLFIISKDNIKLLSTYTENIVGKIPVKGVQNILFAKDGYQFIAITRDSLFIFDSVNDSLVFSSGKNNYDKIIPLNANFGFIGISKNVMTITTKNSFKRITLPKPILNAFITEVPPSKRISKIKSKKKKSKKQFVFYTVQYLSTKNKKHAFLQKDKFIKNGFPSYIKELNMDNKSWYRLRIGDFKDKSEALLFSVYLTETLNHGCWVTADTLDSVPHFKFTIKTDLNGNGKQDIAFIDNDRKLRIFEIDGFRINLVFTSEIHFPVTTKIIIKDNKLKLLNDNTIFTLVYGNNKFSLKKSQ